jgi:hypothetical protein
MPETLRCHLGVAYRVLDILVAQIGLQAPRVMTFVGLRVVAGVSQHTGWPK